MPEQEIFTFAFFPYLKTSEPIRYRNIIIRSSEDTSDLSSIDASKHFAILRKMFFLQDFVRIDKMTYAFHSSKDELDYLNFSRRLLEFQKEAWQTKKSKNVGNLKQNEKSCSSGLG